MPTGKWGLPKPERQGTMIFFLSLCSSVRRCVVLWCRLVVFCVGQLRANAFVDAPSSQIFFKEVALALRVGRTPYVTLVLPRLIPYLVTGPDFVGTCRTLIAIVRYLCRFSVKPGSPTRRLLRMVSRFYVSGGGVGAHGAS